MSVTFKARLEAVRSRQKPEAQTKAAYRNGQLCADDDSSAWDNFDRYFKFYNISVDDPVLR